MNLAEALNAALPELPARRARAGFPKLDPDLIASENVEDDEPVIVAMIRGRSNIFRFTPQQWHIIELFDGHRSWDDVADAHVELYGVRYSVDDLREFTSGLDEIDFWYKSPLEKNIALQQKLESSRHDHAHRKSKFDVAHMQFSAWDPDRYFDRIYPWLRWAYTPWFAAACAVMFAFMTWIFVVNWSYIGTDSLQFYNFTQKSTADLAEFWILFLVLAFFHESAHGLTCKHYGGQVHAMGFHLIYLTPAFFVDVSEAWVYASRWQRLVTILAGIGIEMIFCAVATFIWWGTPAGSDIHDLAYKIMLITGVVVVVVNMNPLIKLDGYYAFSELIGFSDIKEKSTAFLSQLVRRHVFHLPVEVDFVPRRRRAGLLIYAVLSGIYSYALLFAVLRFCSNVFAKFSPQWAFVPALILGLFIFRSRLRTLVKFMQTVYLDKRDRVRSWFTAPRLAAACVAAALVLLVPLRHQTVSARFLLEPARVAVVRSVVPGQVVGTAVREGQLVRAGDPLLYMTNTQIMSETASSAEQFALTGIRRVRAQLAYGDLGAALEDNTRARIETALTADEAGHLTPQAPIDGIVATPRLSDLVGRYVDAGTTLAEIYDTRRMRARIFIHEFQVARVTRGARVTLLFDGSFRPDSAFVEGIEPGPDELPAAVESIRQAQGGSKLTYYVADVVLQNDGSLYTGMTGTAKILIRRECIARFAWRTVGDFVDRKIW